MPAMLLPLAERLGRFALRGSGVRSRWIWTPEARLHSYDARGVGELPTTVLLHGIGSAATPFGGVLRNLRRDMRRVVAPEMPGHGFSDSTVEKLTPEVLFSSVASAMDTLIEEPAIVVGNSLGGALALQYAIERPENVRGLVLVSPAGAPSSEAEWEDLKSTFDVTTRREAKAFFDRVYHRAPWFMGLLAHELPGSLARPAVRDLLESASNEDIPLPEALRDLEMPILLVWGKSERLLPERHLDYFAENLPEHTIIERPEGFGHCPHFDDPVALAARIAEFARSIHT